MSTSNRPMHRLIVDAPEPGLGVLVIDNEGNIVARCTDEQSRIEIDLPHGLYTVRSIRNGAFTETGVRLDSSKSVKAAEPPVFSAATIPGAETTYEYYTYPAWEASQTPTGREHAWNGAADASLLLFVRAPQREAYHGENQLATLSLRTLEGWTLSSFDVDAKRGADGWSAYSARLSHGLLIIEDRGELPRQIPVPLMCGMQTQLFLMHRGRLLWEDMRLSMVSEQELASRRHRSPYDQNSEDVRVAMDMDAGLLALQNNTPSVAPQLIQAFLNTKLQNPILGLLAAYLMLLHHRQEAKTPHLKSDSAYILTVLDNLHSLLPGSADVRALRLLAENRLESPKVEPITGLPLFRCGAEVLLKAVADDPSLLPEGSMLDVVSEYLCGDTVWTTWKPIPLPIVKRVTSVRTSAADVESSWLEQTLLDVVSVCEANESSFTAEYLLHIIGASPHAVRHTIEQLMDNATKSPTILQGEGHNLMLLQGNTMRKLAQKVGAKFDPNPLNNRVLSEDANLLSQFIEDIKKVNQERPLKCRLKEPEKQFFEFVTMETSKTLCTYDSKLAKLEKYMSLTFKDIKKIGRRVLALATFGKFGEEREPSLINLIDQIESASKASDDYDFWDEIIVSFASSKKNVELLSLILAKALAFSPRLVNAIYKLIINKHWIKFKLEFPVFTLPGHPMDSQQEIFIRLEVLEDNYKTKNNPIIVNQKMDYTSDDQFAYYKTGNRHKYVDTQYDQLSSRELGAIKH
jgi:hypothetical protein